MKMLQKDKPHNLVHDVTLNEQELIQTIYKFHDNGKTFRDILNLVNELGYKSITNKPISLIQIAKILSKRNK
jgi:hypothetical protein